MSRDLENKFLHIIQNDPWLMDLLKHAQTLQLEHWAIGAGAVRSAVWDSLHGFQRKTPPSDIDFLFYDSEQTSPDYEKEIEGKLSKLEPHVRWEAVNQATIHVHNEEEPYTSIDHALTRWAETATAVGIYLDSTNHLKYFAPHGLDDLMKMIFRPHLVTPKSREVYLDRMANKNFQKKWPNITILMPD